MPCSQRPSRRAPGSPRRSQPKRSAPSRRHATRLREREARARPPGARRARCGSAARSGRCPRRCASSSIADSSAYMPGHSPGARSHDGVGTSSATSRCAVRRFGAAYIQREQIAVCSANSFSREVCSVGLVRDRLQAAVRVRAEPQALDRRRAVARVGEHLLAGGGDLDRALDDLRGDRGEHHVRARQALGAEAAADVRGDHAHLRGLELEHLGDRARHARRALRRVVERQPAVLPDRDGRVRLHRVVVERGRRVGRVDGDRGRGERAVGVALPGLVRERRVDLLGRVELRDGRRAGSRRAGARRSRRARARPPRARPRATPRPRPPTIWPR